MFIFMIVWFIAGVAAFIASIVCMVYDSSVGTKEGSSISLLFSGYYTGNKNNFIHDSANDSDGHILRFVCFT